MPLCNVKAHRSWYMWKYFQKNKLSEKNQNIYVLGGEKNLRFLSKEKMMKESVVDLTKSLSKMT